MRVWTYVGSERWEPARQDDNTTIASRVEEDIGEGSVSMGFRRRAGGTLTTPVNVQRW